MHSAQRKSKSFQFKLLLMSPFFSLLLETHHRDAPQAEALLCSFLCFVFFSCIASFLPGFNLFTSFFVLGFFRKRDIHFVRGCQILPLWRCPCAMVNPSGVTYTIAIKKWGLLCTELNVRKFQLFTIFVSVKFQCTEKYLWRFYLYKKFSLFFGLLDYFNISAQYPGLWMFIERFPWL